MKSKINIIAIGLIFLLLFFYGIRHFKSSNSEEYKFIHNEVMSHSHRINLSNFNLFEWTGVTIYRPYDKISTIQKETLINASVLDEYSELGSLTEGISLIVFWNNDKVVSHIFFSKK